MLVSAPKTLLKPIHVPNKLLMGPGPSNVSPRVMAAGALPVLGHMHTETFKIMDEIKEGARYVFQTKNNLTFAVSGSGHAAMETTVSNLIESGDTVLVGVNGVWGERFSDMVERKGGIVRQMRVEVPTVFTLHDIEAALKQHRPKALFLVQGESSAGVHQPLEGVGRLCHAHNCLLVVDTVASLGGVPFLMDEWEVDCVYTGSQKVLGAPPGTAPMSFSPRAVQVMTSRKTKPSSYYLDVMTHLANYWGCDAGPRRYHHTGLVTLFYQLREGLALVAEEGLQDCWKRHERVAGMLHAGLRDLGLELFVSNPAHRLPTVTTVKVPPGIDWKLLPKFAMENYKFELSGGLGPTAGKVWRIGLMGYNANEENVRFTLRVVKEGLEYCRSKSSKL